MSKILLLAVCLIAVASASPYTCQIYEQVCTAVNGSCSSYQTSNTAGDISYWSPQCPSGTYENSQGSGSCKCTQFTQVIPTLGQACTQDQVNYLIPAGSHRCVQSQFSSDSGQYKWFGFKKTGDLCSNDYECLPPRKCNNGVCTPKLNRGDVCYNSTVFRNTECQLADYCPASGSERVCTQRVAENAVCTDLNACPPYQSCKSAEDGSNSTTCQTAKRYYLPVGAASTSSSLCASGIMDANRTCVDYDTVYQAYLPHDGIRCTDTENCTYFGSCSCRDVGVNVYKGYCRWTRSTPSSLVSSYAASINLAKSYYNMGCESNAATPLTSDSNYCYVRAGLTVYNFDVCNGAGTASQSSILMVTMAIAAVIAMISSQ